MGDTVLNQSGGVDISGQANVGGDMAGRDIIKQTVYQGDVPLAQALHQLPAPPADFTGREVDLTAILNDIAGGAIISGVRGMGGIGKTALALVIADKLKTQYPDAQFFVNLRGASDKPLSTVEALTAVIRGFHPVEKLSDDEAGLRALYLSDLHDKRALIVLDDARDDAQVKPLIPPKTCLLLITTRNHFHVAGLQAHDLETLLPEDARRLVITIAPRLTPIPYPSPVDEKRVDRGRLGGGPPTSSPNCAGICRWRWPWLARRWPSGAIYPCRTTSSD